MSVPVVGMRIRVAVPEEYIAPDVIDGVLEGVTRLNEHMIRAGYPTARELIGAGARWRPENPGDEYFDHGGTIAARGWGDCDDWAPLHAASLRASGEDTGAIARVVPSGPNTYHAIVQRSDGKIDDPSIEAGMAPLTNVSGADGSIQVRALDPHDGRVYEGSLVPTDGPLSLHCGPGVSVVGGYIAGAGPLYRARCDIPIVGSPLVHVHARVPRRHHHRDRHHRRVHGTTVVGGAVPYAFSCSAYGCTPAEALNGAICGAILCGDAAELTTSLDKYKLLAAQGALAGMSPGQVHDSLVQQMQSDIQAAAGATNTDPQQHTQQLLADLASQGIHTSGGCVVGDWYQGPQGETVFAGQRVVVGDIFSDIGKIASGVVHAVAPLVNDVSKVVNVVPWGDIVHGVQAVVSLVPGLGTVVSDVIAAGETAYDSAAALLGGNPLEAALDAAYNFALASVPGADALRIPLDPVVHTIINMTSGHEPIETAALNSLLNSVPDAPKIGGYVVGSISPRSVASSLAHIVVSHLGAKNTSSGKAPAAKAAAAPKPAPKPAPKAPPRISLRLGPQAKPAVKPPGVPHAAVHVATVAPPKPATPATPQKWVCTPGAGGSWSCQWT